MEVSEGKNKSVKSSDEIMSSSLGKIIAATSTSSQWSTLEGLTTKVNKRIARSSSGLSILTPYELDNFLLNVDKEDLLNHGIWRHSFGKKYMPIVLINTAFASTMKTNKENVNENGHVVHCSCGPDVVRKKAKRDTNDVERYFGSNDYNAGRHASNLSEHKPQCIMWRPPNAGHLHSWRRGYSKK